MSEQNRQPPLTPCERIAILTTLSEAELHVIDTVTVMLCVPGWNRTASGQFRRMPTAGQRCRECLLLIRDLAEFANEGEQDAINHWLKLLDDQDAAEGQPA